MCLFCFFFEMWSSRKILKLIGSRMNTNENTIQLTRETCVHLYHIDFFGWVALKQQQQQQQKYKKQRQDQHQQRTIIIHKHWSLIEFIKFFKSWWSHEKCDRIELEKSMKLKKGNLLFITLFTFDICLFERMKIVRGCWRTSCWCFNLKTNDSKVKRSSLLRKKQRKFQTSNWIDIWRRLYLSNLLVE